MAGESDKWLIHFEGGGGGGGSITSVEMTGKEDDLLEGMTRLMGLYEQENWVLATEQWSRIQRLFVFVVLSVQ